MDALHPLSPLVWACALVLAFISFPFIWWVDRRLRDPSVKLVYALFPDDAQLARERRNAWLTTPVHAVLLGLLCATGALRLGDETLFRILGTFALTFVWTEIWHYTSHRAMHWPPLHWAHVEHHRSRITGPWTSVYFSLVEKSVFSLGILGGVAAVSHWSAVSILGITAYYVLSFFTNTLGHSNYEFRAPDYRSTWTGRIFNSPAYHAMHHARYINNYGLLTPWLDQLLGTEWPDAARVQTRAALGDPLTRLQERP